ncbi:MAG: alpha-amylase family glycosyl hydrolase [Cyanobacteriota bacterium]|nr:alpha-amylase family glycosyl hydrolase [Cyanobacteriota bacterium]
MIDQVFIDRFAPDPGATFPRPADLAGMFGGTLRGLRHRLDHLQAPGITCLWLTPLFPNPSHHGDDPINLGTVEPRLGTLEDWDALVATPAVWRPRRIRRIQRRPGFAFAPTPTIATASLTCPANAPNAWRPADGCAIAGWANTSGEAPLDLSAPLRWWRFGGAEH